MCTPLEFSVASHTTIRRSARIFHIGLGVFCDASESGLLELLSATVGQYSACSRVVEKASALLVFRLTHMAATSTTSSEVKFSYHTVCACSWLKSIPVVSDQDRKSAIFPRRHRLTEVTLAKPFIVAGTRFLKRDY